MPFGGVLITRSIESMVFGKLSGTESNDLTSLSKVAPSMIVSDTW
jgi:hypothetical protein